MMPVVKPGMSVAVMKGPIKSVAVVLQTQGALSVGVYCRRNEVRCPDRISMRALRPTLRAIQTGATMLRSAILAVW